jgi:hypothetical protein
MSDEDWREVGNRVCEILTRMYRDSRPFFEKEAQRRGIELEQLAGAAIAGMVREYVEHKSAREGPSSRGPIRPLHGSNLGSG